jgi:hypothetical protein
MIWLSQLQHSTPRKNPDEANILNKMMIAVTTFENWRIIMFFEHSSNN